MIEVMVALGVTGVLGLAISTTMNVANRGKRSVDQSGQWSALLTTINAALSNEANCRASFSGLTFSNGSVAQTTVAIKSANATLIQSGANQTPSQQAIGIQINSLYVSGTESGGTNGSGTFNMKLHIDGVKTGSGAALSAGNKALTHDFVFTIITDAATSTTRTFKDCYSTLSSEESDCNALGGAYTFGANPPCSNGWVQSAPQVIQTIQSVTNVGIGTNNPTATLEVTGTLDSAQSTGAVQQLVITPNATPPPSPVPGQIWVQ